MHETMYVALVEFTLTWENRSTLRKPCPIATFSTINLTRTGLGSNPSLRCDRPATNPLLKSDFNLELYLNIQLVPRSKHPVWVMKTSQSMLYREINTLV